jgi:CBS domain-containing protein
MNSPLTAGDIMTHDVATTTANSSLKAAIVLMLGREVSGLPVLDGFGAIIGILTEGDLLRRVELGTGEPHTSWLNFFRGQSRAPKSYVATHSRVVGDIMTTTVITVDEAAPLSEVVSIMQSKHIKRLPVLASGLLVGMVSRADLLRALAEAFATSDGEPAFSDADIRKTVLAEFGRQRWGMGEGIKVRVVTGWVDLDGVIFNEAQRDAIRVAAQNVPGVTAVRDHLVWVEPNSGMTYGMP